MVPEHLRDAGDGAAETTKATTEVTAVAQNHVRERDDAAAPRRPRRAGSACLARRTWGVVHPRSAGRFCWRRWSPRSWAAAVSRPAYEMMVGELLADELPRDGPGCVRHRWHRRWKSRPPQRFAHRHRRPAGWATAATAVEAPVLDVSRRIVTYTAHTEDLLHKPIPSSNSRGPQPAVCRRCLERLGTRPWPRPSTTPNGAPRSARRSGKYQAVAHRLVDHGDHAATPAAAGRRRGRLRYPRRRTADAAGRRRDLPVEPATEIVGDCIQLCGGIGFFHLGMGTSPVPAPGGRERSAGLGAGGPRADTGAGGRLVNTAVDEYRSRVRQFHRRATTDGDWYDGIRVPPGSGSRGRRAPVVRRPVRRPGCMGGS